MDYDAGDLRIESFKNSYYINDKKRFIAYGEMLKDDKEECFDFAFGMSYGGEGEHREYRTGGKLQRSLGQIFINTFQGKMAEFALYRYFIDKNIDISKPDTEKYERGTWDCFDLECQNKHISVKSTKGYGNLLLLETQDWNDDGEYVPNLDHTTSKYDYIVLVRFSPDGEQIMKSNGLLHQKESEIPENIKDILTEKVRDVSWHYDFPGFIFHSELIKLIRDRRIIPQGALLNGKKIMDAENYYFQAGNMHSMEEIFTITKVTKEDHAQDLLIRMCPDCQRPLIIKNGQYGYFWSCSGFPQYCEYKESIDWKIKKLM